MEIVLYLVFDVLLISKLEKYLIFSIMSFEMNDQ
jgi:hypothetical protein